MKPRLFLSLILLCNLYLPVFAAGDDIDNLLNEEPAKNQGGGALGETGQTVTFRLVKASDPAKSIDDQLYWRTVPGLISAETFPPRFRLGGADVIAPAFKDKTEGVEVEMEYPTQNKAPMAEGSGKLTPGDIPLTMRDGTARSQHPAIKIEGSEVRILCAPVKLEAVDASGRPIPTQMTVNFNNQSLLRKEGKFCPLVLWLPVGVNYDSSLGSFQLKPDGSIVAVGNLPADVTQTKEGFRLTVKASASEGTAADSKVAPAPGKLFLAANRRRSVFAQSESPVFYVFMPKGFAGGEAKLTAAPAAGGDAFSLGTLALPAVKDARFDSRFFIVHMPDLPTGAYRLTLTVSGATCEPLPFRTVSLYKRSPFFVHTMSGCTEPWPDDDAGLKTLHEAGIEMVTSTGHHSMMDTLMPVIDPKVAAEHPELPQELALKRQFNDQLLERILVNGITTIDLTPIRGTGMYLETLSYHHSYKPSVDRMIKHMQIYAQQTADYPSFGGVNYSWFPALFGYAEGGVPTDAHVGDRNRVLNETVAKAGFATPTKEQMEQYKRDKLSTYPQKRDAALAIMRAAVAQRDATFKFGFGAHNKLYNDAVREVRPDLTCTLFENAGHDAEGKPAKHLFGDMAAACYESYSDYGDWPMSSAFTTDWIKGTAPGMPVWLTVCWGMTTESNNKSLFQAFARGMDGGGFPMQASNGNAELARRGKAMRVLQSYGALTEHAKPDNRFAILTTQAEQTFQGRSYYDVHALYYHMTRLGCAPVVISDDTIIAAGSIPESVKVLLIGRQGQPLEPKLSDAIAAFQKRGGKVITAATCDIKIPGAIEVAVPIKNIWEYSGFTQTIHAEMWREFLEKWRKPLAEALAKTGVPALATTDPEQAIVLTMDTPTVRYLMVIADKKETSSSFFESIDNLPISVADTGWQVRDLVKQKDLKAESKDGRTQFNVDLITEPATLIALYKAPPAKVCAKIATAPRAGEEIVFTADVTDNAGKSMGPVPVRLKLSDAAGAERMQVFAGAGDLEHYMVPRLERTGTWKLEAQELLTGLSVTLDAAVQPGTAAATVDDGDVHVVDERLLQLFTKRTGELLIIVEPGQEKLLSLAQDMEKKLAAAGATVRIWQVKPEEFDTIPVRWYPRTADTQRLKLVDEGKLIGYRGNMVPYIDKKARAHVPERGGYTEIEPLWMVGKDCIIFSGGQLCESLRAVSAWVNTPNVPGHGQGRILVALSPFNADRDALAILANDPDGMRKAADRVIAAYSKRATPVAATSTAAAKPPAKWELQSDKTAQQPLVCDYIGFTPLRRIERLMATADGKAVVMINGKKDTIAFVDPAGKVTATAAPEGGVREYDRIDNQGNLWHYLRNPLESNEAWHFATAHSVPVKCIAPDGTLVREFEALRGKTDTLPCEWYFEGSLPISPDGKGAALGRKNGLLFGKFGELEWKRYDDLPFVQLEYEVRTGRFPVAVTYSPDSTCVFFTMDCRPRMGGMGVPQPRPTGSESVLLDLTTGQKLWRLRDEDPVAATYSSGAGFVAIAEKGAVTAFTDLMGKAFLVSREGKILFSQDAGSKPVGNEGVKTPKGGIGVCISNDGQVAAFAFTRKLLLVKGVTAKEIDLPGICSLSMSPDGTLTVVGLNDGSMKAFKPDGSSAWNREPDGVNPYVAILANHQTLVAISTGELVTLDANGKELRRVNVAEIADREKHVPAKSANFQALLKPREYYGPGTLDTAKKMLKAERVAAWQPPAGNGTKLYEFTFFPVTTPIDLKAAPSVKDCFVHVVYRRPVENKTLQVITKGKDGEETFTLDLPTPEYREVDIPIRGPNASVTIKTDGPAEFAEVSIWKIEWPGANRAYVKQPGAGLTDAGAGIIGEEENKGKGGDDLDGQAAEDMLDGNEKASAGAMKECNLWIFNTDPDQVSGCWIKPRLSPLEAVDGKRFGNGKKLAWALGDSRYAPYRGAWVTINFGQPAEFTLVATYDFANKQSAAGLNLNVFSGFDEKDSASGKTVAAKIGSDQFWNLFPLPKGTKIQILGAQTYTDSGTCGLTEVEAYK